MGIQALQSHHFSSKYHRGKYRHDFQGNFHCFKFYTSLYCDASLFLKVAIFCLLAVSVSAAPKADPQVPIAPLPAEFTHLAPNCVTEYDEIEVQSCTPRAETVCNTIDVVNQKITYEKRCKEVTSRHCPTVSTPVGATVLLKKREAEAEAEADPQFFWGGHPYAAPVVHAPVTQVIRHACQEVTSEHCVDTPVVVEEPAPVEYCYAVHKVDCAPSVQQIPKVTCDPVEVETPVVAAPAPVVNPVAYRFF